MLPIGRIRFVIGAGCQVIIPSLRLMGRTEFDRVSHVPFRSDSPAAPGSICIPGLNTRHSHRHGARMSVAIIGDIGGRIRRHSETLDRRLSLNLLCFMDARACAEEYSPERNSEAGTSCVWGGRQGNAHRGLAGRFSAPSA